MLQRITGGEAVFAAQLDHLQVMARRPDTSVRILPMDERAHAAWCGGFKLLTADGPGPFLGVTEDVSTGFSYREDRTVVEQHHTLWRWLREASSALA